MSEEMLSCMQQQFEELIANAYTTVQKRRTSQTWCLAVAKASFRSQGVYEKDQAKKAYIRRFLMASRMNEVFHASQLQTKTGLQIFSIT